MVDEHVGKKKTRISSKYLDILLLIDLMLPISFRSIYVNTESHHHRRQTHRMISHHIVPNFNFALAARG